MHRHPIEHLFRSLFVALVVYCSVSPSSAAPLPPSAFAREKPDFDLIHFFTGHTRSWGVLEDAHGAPTDRIRTETWGRLIHGELRLEQDLFIGQKPRSH